MSPLTPESIRANQAELPPIGTVITELAIAHSGSSRPSKSSFLRKPMRCP